MTIHRDIVGAVVADRGLSTARFMESVIKAAKIDATDTRKVVSPALIPDAYKIDRASRTVDAYEVEVTSPVTEDKLDRFAALAWELDGEEWDLRLFIVNRFGHVSPPVDLLAVWHGLLRGARS